MQIIIKILRCTLTSMPMLPRKVYSCLGMRCQITIDKQTTLLLQNWSQWIAWTSIWMNATSRRRSCLSRTKTGWVAMAAVELLYRRSLVLPTATRSNATTTTASESTHSHPNSSKDRVTLKRKRLWRILTRRSTQTRTVRLSLKKSSKTLETQWP